MLVSKEFSYHLIMTVAQTCWYSSEPTWVFASRSDTGMLLWSAPLQTKPRFCFMMDCSGHYQMRRPLSTFSDDSCPDLGKYCSLQCPSGYEKDDFGCEVCECSIPPPKCRPLTCTKTCPYGYVYVYPLTLCTFSLPKSNSLPFSSVVLLKLKCICFCLLQDG